MKVSHPDGAPGMDAGQHEPCACTSVEFHEVDGDGRAAAPAAVLAREPAPAGAPLLVIVGGSFAHAAARARAVRIAGRQTDEALCIAVFEIGADLAPPEQAHVGELDAAYHAVVIVTRGQRREVVSRLVRTILRLDGQDQWISCNWHDVRHVVRTSGGAAVRFGYGHGSGSERAARATLGAIRQADRQGPGLRAAGGICIGIRAASNDMYGREIKEVIHQVRAHVTPDATITMSIGSDSALEGGAFEVDIFAFGPFDEAERARQGASSEDTVPDAGECPGAAGQGDGRFRDPLYAAARSLVIRHQHASISLVQRTLRIGYGRASRLLDSMEGDILSTRSENGQRTILVSERPKHPIAE